VQPEYEAKVCLTQIKIRIISIVLCKGELKAILLQAWRGCEFSKSMRFPGFMIIGT